jgi:hypothetical protein
MDLSFENLRAIASSGGGMIIDATKFSFEDLRAIASSASGKQAQIVLRKVSGLSFDELRSIASSGKGSVVFDFLS